VQQAWLDSGGQRGWQAQLARTLHVHKATITRDLRVLKASLGW
jgi:hypothetical protein